MGLMMKCYGIAVQRMGMLGVRVKKMKELFGKDSQNLMRVV